MSTEQKPARGRPRTITPARIADAGIKLGLANVTFTGLAAELGVSHMALYKHVPSLDMLKRLIAEEIFGRWAIPPASRDTHHQLQDYLQLFTASLSAFVKAHPGLTPYLLRRTAATPPMLAKISEHQRQIAQIYDLPQQQARWLLATVAFHCIAVADTLYSVASDAASDDPASAAARQQETAEMEAEFIQGMQALIVGALTLLQQSPPPAA